MSIFELECFIKEVIDHKSCDNEMICIYEDFFGRDLYVINQCSSYNSSHSKTYGSYNVYCEIKEKLISELKNKLDNLKTLKRHFEKRYGYHPNLEYDKKIGVLLSISNFERTSEGKLGCECNLDSITEIKALDSMLKNRNIHPKCKFCTLSNIVKKF